VGDLREILGIYRRVVGARIRSQLQYRLSFALTSIGMTLTTFLDFAAILILFEQVDALGEWTVAEVGVLYGITSVSYGLTELAIGHINRLPTMIRRGDFDLVLLRPLGSLFQVIASDFALRRLGRFTQGIAVLVVAAVSADVDWTAGRFGMLALGVVAGAAIFAGIWIGLATAAFWLIDSMEVATSFAHGGQLLAQYPVNIFGPWLRRLVLFVIPVSFVSYFPALFVLDKEDPLGLPTGLQFVSPLVAVVTCVAGGLLWRAAVRRYQSVGA
jgi:ABC-2 type transport system permease protein